MNYFSIWTIQILMVPVLSPLAIGIIRKIKARFQNRKGADIFQHYRDLIKLLGKDEVISSDASWIFRFAPYIVMGTTLVIAAGIPIATRIQLPYAPDDFLTIACLVALGSFFLALAGLDTGGAFGGLGASREMTLAALAEASLIFSFLVLAILSSTSSLFGIADASVSTLISTPVPLLLAFFGFAIALLCETARFPFDNPATHLELTMVHEAMILEYSGKRLMLVEWAASNKLFIFMILGANLFFPLGLTTSVSLLGILTALVFLAVKVLVMCIAIAILESSIAKLRFFKLPDLLFVSFVFSAIALGLVII